MTLVEALAYLDNIEKFLLVLGVLTILLALLSPRTFFGIEVDWKPWKSCLVLLFGLLMFALSFPQIRHYLMPALITLEQVDQLNAELREGKRITVGAGTNTSDATGCTNGAKAAVPHFDKALAVVTIMQEALAIPKHN